MYQELIEVAKPSREQHANPTLPVEWRNPKMAAIINFVLYFHVCDVYECDDPIQ